MTRDADIELIVRIVLRVLDVLGHGGDTRPPAAPATAVAPLRLATERDVLEAVPAGVLRLTQGAVVTALAREAAEARGVRLVVG